MGEEALSKEVIDAIMEENGRDITKAKADAITYSDYEDIKKERDALKGQQVDNLADGKTAQQWKKAHDQAVSNHKKELDTVTPVEGTIMDAATYNATHPDSAA